MSFSSLTCASPAITARSSVATEALEWLRPTTRMLTLYSPPSPPSLACGAPCSAACSCPDRLDGHHFVALHIQRTPSAARDHPVTRDIPCADGVEVPHGARVTRGDRVAAVARDSHGGP